MPTEYLLRPTTPDKLWQQWYYVLSQLLERVGGLEADVSAFRFPGGNYGPNLASGGMLTLLPEHVGRVIAVTANATATPPQVSVGRPDDIGWSVDGGAILLAVTSAAPTTAALDIVRVNAGSGLPALRNLSSNSADSNLRVGAGGNRGWAILQANFGFGAGPGTSWLIHGENLTHI